jgi:hypothetical protein
MAFVASLMRWDAWPCPSSINEVACVIEPQMDLLIISYLGNNAGSGIVRSLEYQDLDSKNVPLLTLLTLRNFMVFEQFTPIYS